MGVTHAASGAGVWLIGCATTGTLGYGADPRVMVVGTAVTALGALVPDIDCRGSLITRSLPPVTVPLYWGVVALSRYAWRSTATPLDRKRAGRDAGAHRYLTHTWPWVLGCAVLALAVAAPLGWWWTALAFGLGNAVHIAGDWPTESGVPWKWPILIRGRRWERTGPPRALRFRVNGAYERLIIGPTWLVLGALSTISIMTGVPTWR